MADATDEEMQTTYAELGGPPGRLRAHIHASSPAAPWIDSRERGQREPVLRWRPTRGLCRDRWGERDDPDGWNTMYEAKELLRSGLPHAEWLSQILLAGKYCPPERSEG